MVSTLKKIGNLVVNEISAMIVFLIVKWPNSPIGIMMRRVYWRRKIGSNKIYVGRGAYLEGCDQIVFGDNTEIGENVEISVGDGYPVFIGSNILFARGVYLRSANHRFDDLDKLIMEQGHISKKINYNGSDYSVVIESNSWIGANVIILSGAKIGEGSVIGAGSIVTGVIPPYSIAVGCPARVIAKRK